MPSGASATRIKSLDAATTDEQLGMPFDASFYPYVTFIVQGTGTTSSGVVTIEEATYDPTREGIYSGTWSSITTVNASDVSGGAQKFVHLVVSAYHFVRPRISTAIGGGGSVTVYIKAEGAS